VFTLTASPVNHAAATVLFKMKGTAKLGTDYTLSANGQITIPAGQASVTVTLHSLVDADKKTESAKMQLRNGTGYKRDVIKKAVVQITQ